jgi:hypothetical protein
LATFPHLFRTTSTLLTDGCHRDELIYLSLICDGDGEPASRQELGDQCKVVFAGKVLESAKKKWGGGDRRGQQPSSFFFLVPDWEMKLAMASGCRTGLPDYLDGPERQPDARTSNIPPQVLSVTNSAKTTLQWSPSFSMVTPPASPPASRGGEGG